MQYRKLGRTKLNVSVIGFGGIPIQRLTKESARELILNALNKGINFIDTARAYSDSEEKIGYAISALKKKPLISTKSAARKKAELNKDIELSFKNLGVDYIDLYNIHFLKSKNELNNILSKDGALSVLRKNNRIKNVGITGHNIELLCHAVETNEFDTVMFPFNSIEQEATKLIELANDLDIGTIVMKPIAGGIISQPVNSIRLCLEQKITNIVVGMDSISQLHENTAKKIFTPLTDKEKTALNKEAKQLGNKFCRRCGYCLPCTKNINIPVVFIYYLYFTRYKLQKWALDRYKQMKRHATDCIKCKKCEQRCPYNLPICEMMEEVAHNMG
jgi:hypothetical protein